MLSFDVSLPWPIENFDRANEYDLNVLLMRIYIYIWLFVLVQQCRGRLYHYFVVKYSG